MARIQASWLTNLQSDLNSNNTSKNLPTIAAVSKNSGDAIQASDINTFITRLKELSSNTFFQHALWNNFDTSVKSQGTVIKEEIKTELEGLVTELKTINGNYSVSVQDSNVANSNTVGCNQTSFDRILVTGFGGDFVNFSRTTGNTKSCNHVPAFFSETGNFNVGSFSITQTGFTQCGTNFVTFGANTNNSRTSGCSEKYSNNGLGHTNFTQACTNFSRSGFATESDLHQTFVPGSSSDSNTPYCNETVNFSVFQYQDFSQTCTDNGNLTNLGGNSRTCTTTLESFAVKGTTIVSNTNFNK